MTTSNLPVYMYGTHVGVVAIRDDGTFSLLMDMPIKFTTDLKESYDKGEIQGVFLELAPMPNPPQPAEEPEQVSV